MAPKADAVMVSKGYWCWFLSFPKSNLNKLGLCLISPPLPRYFPLLVQVSLGEGAWKAQLGLCVLLLRITQD